MKQLPYINKSEGIIGYSESTIAKSETNDCFVRAVASSYECPYDIAHEWVKNKFKRINRKGTKYTITRLDSMVNNKETFFDKTITSVPNLKVFIKEIFKVKRTTLNQFIKKHSSGTYIILVRGHAFTLKNGAVIGNSEDSKKLKRIINAAYEIK